MNWLLSRSWRNTRCWQSVWVTMWIPWKTRKDSWLLTTTANSTTNASPSDTSTKTKLFWRARSTRATTTSKRNASKSRSCQSSARWCSLFPPTYWTRSWGSPFTGWRISPPWNSSLNLPKTLYANSKKKSQERKTFTTSSKKQKLSNMKKSLCWQTNWSKIKMCLDMRSCPLSWNARKT